MDNRRFIARRAAQYFNEGDTVNLGIGIPSACSDYVDPTIAFQTENGMIGVGPVAKKLAICDTYQNAGGINFVPVMGASAFDTAYSFAVIRSGRMAATVLGALQVAENGDIANWASPGRAFGMGGEKRISPLGKIRFCSFSFRTRDRARLPPAESPATMTSLAP